MRRSWFVTLDEGTPRDAIFDPGYWIHHAAKLRPLDKLYVTDDACTFYLECLIVGIDQHRAYMQKISESSLVKPHNSMMRICTFNGLGRTGGGKSCEVVVTRHARQPRLPWQASLGAVFNRWSRPLEFANPVL